MAHMMAGGSYCAVIGGRIAYKGAQPGAWRAVKAARKSGEDGRAYVLISPRAMIGEAAPT